MLFRSSRRRPREYRGAVAQLGERCNRTAEVRGSIPLSSTEGSQVLNRQLKCPPPRGRTESSNAGVRGTIKGRLALHAPAAFAFPGAVKRRSVVARARYTYGHA